MPGSRRLRAFTLTEMIVSIGILVLMMSMVGTVFKVSTDSTGQARALMEVTSTGRLFEETLKQDLAQLNSQRSILVIQANRVNAYWRDDHRELDLDGDPSNGYPHPADPEREKVDGSGDMDAPRADMLMFFTSHKQRSVMFPDIWSNVAQVVYGHAEVGDLDKDGAWTGVPPTPFPAPPGPGAIVNIAAENGPRARR
ncbi:MAG: type II secretion system protein J, partial [Phycisphaerae bacterium]